MWFSLILILQLAMWGSAEEPPGTMEAGPPETVANVRDTYEKRKSQLDSLKDIMLKSKQSLKKKEEMQVLYHLFYFFTTSIILQYLIFFLSFFFF